MSEPVFESRSFTAFVPSVEDVERLYSPPPADFCLNGNPGKEVVAIGTAVYQGVIPAAYDSHKNMVMCAAWDFGPGNVWNLPSRARLAYPFAPLYAVASLFKTEKLAARRADWFLWMDDDVVVPRDLVRKLRAAADPQERPVVAAVGYDRYPPFRAAVWEPKDNGKGLHWIEQWQDQKPSGVHQVDCTGLCAAIFHRSFFERVPQPWFASMPGDTDTDGHLDHRLQPDGWLCQRCRDAGIPVYVTCDVDITHMGLSMPVNRLSAPGLRLLFGKAGDKDTTGG